MTRVLVAEDEPSILLSLEFLLRQAGYEVLTAEDGAYALELATRHVPDLAVLDIMLPRLDGFDLTRAFRASARLKAVPILVLTARGREQEIERALALGANAYMTKPFATKELTRAVERLLGRAAETHPAT